VRQRRDLSAKRIVASLSRLLTKAGLGQAGRAEEAKEALAKTIAITPGSFEMYVRKRVPWHRPEDHAHFLEGLRKAGWRET